MLIFFLKSEAAYSLEPDAIKHLERQLCLVDIDHREWKLASSSCRFLHLAAAAEAARPKSSCGSRSIIDERIGDNAPAETIVLFKGAVRFQ